MMGEATINPQSLTGFWDQFFHAPEGLLTLAVFRLAFGLLLLMSAISFWRAARFCFHPTGALATEDHAPAFQKNYGSLFNYLPPSEAAVHLVFALHLVGVTGVLLGFYTRLSAALVFITLASLHSRNFYILNGGDNLQRLLCFLLIFSPAGGALSLDAWLAGSSQAVAAPWAQRLMQVLVAIVYLRTTYWKLRGGTWRAGTAVYYAMNLRDFQRRRLPRWLNRAWFYRSATYATLVVEGAIGTLIWIDPLRYPVILAAILLHLGLEFFMRIGHFQWTMLTALLLFIRPSDLQAWLQPLGLL